MEEYIIREAVEYDLPKIQLLSQEFIEYEKSISTKKYMVNLNWALSQDGYDNYKENIKKEKEYIYVVCYKNEIIGYMTCWVNKQEKWDEYKTFEIGNLYIKKEYQNNGLGTKLVNKAKDLCKANDVKFLKVNALEDNKKAQKFYEKNGLYRYSVEQFTEIK